MTTSTRLFSTNIREDYADVAALQAAVTAESHPAGFAATSSSDLAAKIEFDDAVLHEGVGTVKMTGSTWFDRLTAPLTDCWLRSKLRLSPTVNDVSQFLGSIGFIAIQYEDNVNYFDYVQWSLKAEDAPTAFTGDAYASYNYNEVVNSAEDGAIDLTELQGGAFRDVMVHIVRGATLYGFEAWIDRVPFGRYSVPIPAGFREMTNIESGFSPVVGQAESGDAGDYLHVALLEAYAGGNPYELPAGRPTHRRNARRLALGLLYEETDPRLVGVGR